MRLKRLDEHAVVERTPWEKSCVREGNNEVEREQKTRLLSEADMESF